MIKDDWISGCRSIEITDKRGKDRPGKTWQQFIKNDMKAK